MPYFDYNATTPLLATSREAWLGASSDLWQNPASPYRDAARVKVHFDTVRERLAELTGCESDRFVFTSGATEAANAILAHWARVLPPRARIAVSPTEHPCVLQPATALFGKRISWLPLDRDGVVDIAQLSALLERSSDGAPVAGVIVMAANNETGVIQPWAEIAALSRKAGAEYLCDASQGLGKLPASGLSLVPWWLGSAHKFGGPKGSGLLAKPSSANGFHALLGGEQQHGARAGTEDFPAAAALAAALSEAEAKAAALGAQRLVWRQRFEAAVQTAIPGARVAGASAERLWNTVMLVMPHTENHRWVLKLDKLGFQVSTGSACATGTDGPSHVLTAMGFQPAEARRAVRISSGWETLESDWDSLASAIASVDNELRPSHHLVS